MFESGLTHLDGMDFPILSRRWLLQKPSSLLKKGAAHVEAYSFA